MQFQIQTEILLHVRLQRIHSMVWTTIGVMMTVTDDH